MRSTYEIDFLNFSDLEIRLILFARNDEHFESLWSKKLCRIRE